MVICCLDVPEFVFKDERNGIEKEIVEVLQQGTGPVPPG